MVETWLFGDRANVADVEAPFFEDVTYSVPHKRRLPLFSIGIGTAMQRRGQLQQVS